MSAVRKSSLDVARATVFRELATVACRTSSDRVQSECMPMASRDRPVLDGAVGAAPHATRQHAQKVFTVPLSPSARPTVKTYDSAEFWNKPSSVRLFSKTSAAVDGPPPSPPRSGGGGGILSDGANEHASGARAALHRLGGLQQRPRTAFLHRFVSMLKQSKTVATAPRANRACASRPALSARATRSGDTAPSRWSHVPHHSAVRPMRFAWPL